MTDSLTLRPVLDLIEHCRGYLALHGSDCGDPDCQRFVNEVMGVDVPALRALCEQHAAQLRQVVGGSPMAMAAADFLAPPREPEAE